jgi:hypothetical protein
MFQADWETHLPVLIIDTSAVDRLVEDRRHDIRCFAPIFRYRVRVINGEQSIVGFNDGPETVRMTTWRPSV